MQFKRLKTRSAGQSSAPNSAPSSSFPLALYKLLFLMGCGASKSQEEATVIPVDEALKQQQETAKQFLEKAQKGDVDSQCHLGLLYSIGKGVEMSYTEAAKWYAAAAEKGSVEGKGGTPKIKTSSTMILHPAQNSLGKMYIVGQGVQQDYKGALRFFKLAGEQGSLEAQNEVGTMLKEGQGVEEKNLVEAEVWFKKAADKGSVSAQIELGNIYKDRGLDKEALMWFTMAADQGDASAKLKVKYLSKKAAAADQAA